MAEIKSTLEMVLARADAMCADAPDLPDETPLHEGMRFAASFMSGDSSDISEKISSLTPDSVPLFAQGVIKTYCRFIALPRDDGQAWQTALDGINNLAAVTMPSLPPNLVEIFSEIRSLLGRYKDHLKQLKGQLEEQFAMQAAQLAESMEQRTGTKMNISPDQHPKFHEEWSKVVDQLNSQYTNALDQYKTAIAQIFNISG